MEALSIAIRKAGAALSAQLALTFFVPLCLTGLAIVARMQVRSSVCLRSSCSCNQTLWGPPNATWPIRNTSRQHACPSTLWQLLNRIAQTEESFSDVYSR